MENKNNGIIVEKVREIKGGILKALELKLEQITEIAKDFNYTDLKVHNISFYLYKAVEKGLLSDNEASELFSLITEQEYEHFQEWEKENLKLVKREYILRTSSFYYSCKFDNYYFEDILEGKINNISLEDLLGDLENSTHILLFSEFPQGQMDSIISDFEEAEEEDFETYLNELLECEIEILENFSDELDELCEAVEECKKVYDYLKEYKTKENEYGIAQQFLEYEFAEYYAEVVAEKIFDGIISEHTPLNNITSMGVEKVILNMKSTKYGIRVVSNLKEHTVSLELLEHELSEHYVNCVLHELNYLIEKSFDF